MSDITDHLDDYSSDAVTMFNDARTEVLAGIPSPLPPVPTPPPDSEKQKLDAANKKLAAAQQKLAGSIKQLVFASQTISDEDRRLGLKQVVRLMTVTTETTDAVCAQLQSEASTLGNVDNDQEWRIRMLTLILNAVAAVSPADVWKQPPPPSE